MRRFGSRALAALAAVLFAAGLLVLWPRLHPRDAGLAERAAAHGYAEQIRPILATHCFPCHGNQKVKAKLNLEAFADEAAILKARKTWKRVYDQIQAREM